MYRRACLCVYIGVHVTAKMLLHVSMSAYVYIDVHVPSKILLM